MQAWLNEVKILGKVDGPPSLHQNRNGAPYGSFTITITEASPHGRPLTVLIQVEAWGKHAAQVSTLEPGMLVLIHGALAQRKVPGGAWRLYINALEITVVDQADQADKPSKKYAIAGVMGHEYHR